VAMIESEFSAVDGATDHVLVVGVVGIDECPVVDPESFRTDSASATLPVIRGQAWSHIDR
jgi:hypothetical protein